MIRRTILFLLLGMSALSCVEQPERNCLEHRNGEYWVIVENDGKMDTTSISRSQNIQIEVYKQKRDTSYVRWLNDCEFVLQLANPKNKNEENPLRFKLLTTTDSSYTFEYSIAKSKGRALQGVAVKKR